MTQLYNKVFTLFNQWLSTMEEDHSSFEEWINNKFIYLNGRLHFPSIIYSNHLTNDFNNPQNATITTTNSYIVITSASGGEKKVNVPTSSFTTSDNVFMEWTYVSGGRTQPIAFSMNNSSNSASGGYFSYDGSSFSFSLGSSTSLSRTVNDGDKILVVRYNGYTEVYHNRVLIHRASKSISDSYQFGFYTNNGRIQLLKDIKVGYL